ncbi:phage tail protein [Comamonas fluminis]|uniref:phage tail protein n=1 Tax=Comamonas fluminis TaxID=2796366 RepID=UPI001C48765C|nr:phage tail protein [Comamonas fluminis]
MGGKKKKTTIGYKYYMGLFMGLCRGPVDAIRQIRVGDKTAWTGKATGNTSININQPNLFGGEEQEGGIDGTLQIMMGAPDQTRNDSLAAMLGGLVSAFRGVTTTFFDGLVCAMSPYPKEWSYLVQKTKAGWHKDQSWYPEKCEMLMASGNEVATVFAGSGWNLPCLAPGGMPGECVTHDSIQTVTLTGTAEVRSYELKLFGAVECRPYAGGALQPLQSVMKGGAPTAALPGHNQYTLEISNPPTVFYLNHTNVAEHYNRTFYNGESFIAEIAGNATLTLKALAINDLQLSPSQSLRVEVGGQDGVQVYGMNPAHILRRLYTDPLIGRGLDAATRIDEASWIAAADVFHTEGLGLCMKWSRSGSVAEFAGEVINHAGAAVYTSRRTAKLVLKPIRGDYDLDDLPLFTPDTGLLAIEDDQSTAQTSGINEIVVKYTDVLNKKEGAVREKNLGSIMAAKGVTVTEEVSYPGIPTEALARRIARRDLQAKSGFIKRFTVVLDRRGKDIMPGHVFRISDPSRGIANMVLRAGRSEFGTITDGRITITALQDVFGLPAAVLREPEDNAYVPPDVTPRVPTIQGLMEAPYRELAQSMGAADLAMLDHSAGFLTANAVRPGMMHGFELQTRVVPSEFSTAAEQGAWCPGGKLAVPVGRLDAQVSLDDSVDLSQIVLGTAALLGDEIVRIDAVDTAAGTLTIGRGCADTVPAPHVAGTPLLCYDGWGGDDQREYTHGVTVEAKLLSRTGSGTLNPSLAPTQSLTFASRAARPYPPGDFRINGERYPALVLNASSLSWASRNRITQADMLLDAAAASVVPEAGTTYSVSIYDDLTDTLVSQTDGITDTAMALSGISFPLRTRIELYSVREGLRSWQPVVHVFKNDDSAPRNLRGYVVDAASATINAPESLRAYTLE